MELRLTTCTIRDLLDSDADDMARQANDKEIWRNLKDRFPFPYAVEHARAFITYSRSLDPERNFALVVDGRLAGVIGFEPKEDIWRRSVELGYWLGREYWGRGIASEAARAITDWAFEKWDINRVWAGVFDWNPASTRVLEKAGFVFEGRLHKSATKDGEAVDELIYAVVRT